MTPDSHHSSRRGGAWALCARRLAVAAAALPTIALLFAQTAEAQAAVGAKCLSTEQVNALTRVALPDIITAVSQKCANVLPASAYLNRQAPALSRRLGAQADASVGLARAAVIAMIGNPLIASLPPQAVRQTVGPLIAGAVTTKLQTNDCGPVDTALSALEPLPPANLARLVGVFAVAGLKQPNSQVALRVCESNTATGALLKP